MNRPAAEESADRSAPAIILFIMLDELRADALSCYGNAVCQTPAMDRIAKMGIRFETCIVQSPMCAPSRFSLLTGQYARTHGVLNNGCIPIDGYTSLYAELGKAGYRCESLGRIHVNQDPAAVGFDSHTATGGDGVNSFGILDRAERIANPTARLPGLLPLVFAGRHPRAQSETEPAQVADLTIERLRGFSADKTAGSKERLFLRSSFLAPHTPYLPPIPYDTMYSPDDVELPASFGASVDGKPTAVRFYWESRGFAHLTESDYRRAMASYYGLISHADDQIGRILDELSRLGLAEDTAIVLTADHGSMMSEHGWLEKWGIFYEPVVSVPLLISVPDADRAGDVVSQVVQTIDIMPTVLDIANVEIPETAHGRSLLPEVLPDRPAFSELFASGVMPEPAVMVRTQTHKLCRYPGTADLDERLPLDHPAKFAPLMDLPPVEVELYDLEKDPAEIYNVADDPTYAQVRSELEAAIADWDRSQPVQVEWTDLCPDGPTKWNFFSFENGNLARQVNRMVSETPLALMRSSTQNCIPVNPQPQGGLHEQPQFNDISNGLCEL